MKTFIHQIYTENRSYIAVISLDIILLDEFVKVVLYAARD